MRERRVQLRHVESAARSTGLVAGDLRGRGLREVPRAEPVRLDPVVDPADPRRPLAHLAGQVARREHHGRRTVRDRGTVVLPQRGHEERLLQELLGIEVAGEVRVRVVLRVAPGPRCDLRHLALRVLAPLEERASLQRRERDRVGPQRRDVVRVELHHEDVAERPHRRLPEAVDERAVDVSVLEPDPRLVQRPRAVGLHV